MALPTCDCIGGLTINQKWDAIYAAWYAIADDPTLLAPACLAGLPITAKLDAIYCAILAST